MRFSISALLSALLLAAAPAFAADKVHAPGTTECRWVGDEKVCTTYHQKAKTYGNGFLKPQEVKQCLLDKRSIATSKPAVSEGLSAHTATAVEVQAEGDAIKKKSEEIQAQGKQLQAQRAELDDLKKQIDAPPQDEGTGLRLARAKDSRKEASDRIESFNKKITEFNEANTRYQQTLADQQKTVDAHNARVAEQNAQADLLRKKQDELAQFVAAFNQHCSKANSYEDDISAAEAAIAKDDAAAKK
jgi:chromosome segregation ATPase